MAEQWTKVGIIGVGLMGGSLALSLRGCTAVSEVCGYDSDPDTRLEAREMGVADNITDTPQDTAEGCDLLVLATPVSSVLEAFEEVRESLSSGAIVTDLASAKAGVVNDIEGACPPEVFYVGGHPMTGSEQSGVRSARGDLYRDCYYILTPTRNTSADAFRRLHSLITRLGSRVITMDPGTHDLAMATVSHTPHLLSTLLMDMAHSQRGQMDSLFAVAAGGFRDMTRIAAGNPDIWIDICIENREYIIERLLDYGLRITELVDLLQRSDRKGLRELFERARRARSELSVRSGREIRELFMVSVPVPDRPGVISEISTAAGSVGINIEDIEITHPLEGETGILTLKIMGEARAAAVKDKLETLGYRARMGR